jgi:signal transduction histidine kinase
MAETHHIWQSFPADRSFSAGEFVFAEGDSGDEMYVVDSGRVAVTKGGRGEPTVVLAYYGPGDIIGEMALISHEPRSASVMAVEDTTLRTVSRDRFEHLVADDPDFRAGLISMLADRLRRASEALGAAAVTEAGLFERLSSLASEHERLAELVQLRQETMQFIVHDLRNPLNTIITALSALERAVNLDQAPQAQNLIEVGRGSVRRMLLLVDSILDLARLDSGEKALELEESGLDDLVRNVVARNQPLAATMGVSLGADLPPNLPPAQFDVQRIERVLSNLIENALKFTPNGGQVAVDVQQDGNWLVVGVSDAGPGVPPDQRERIFERFTQAAGESYRRRGFGLGLAFCRAAVQAHGGRIWVEAGPGDVGSRFVFTLPVERA